MRILDVLTPKRTVGNIGENAAVKFLKKKKYRILERNFIAFDAEIDVIAESKSVLCFVEVKTRTRGHENPNEPRPASAVTPEKMRKIIRAAKSYLAFHPVQKHIRFDVIEVYLTAEKKLDEILHMESAYTYNTATEFYR